MAALVPCPDCAHLGENAGFYVGLEERKTCPTCDGSLEVETTHVGRDPLLRSHVPWGCVDGGSVVPTTILVSLHGGWQVADRVSHEPVTCNSTTSPSYRARMYAPTRIRPSIPGAPVSDKWRVVMAFYYPSLRYATIDSAGVQWVEWEDSAGFSHSTPLDRLEAVLRGEGRVV